MTDADRVFAAMREGVDYSPVDLSRIAHVEIYHASRVLKTLAASNMVDQVADSRLLINRKYRTRQKSFDFGLMKLNRE